MAGKWQEGVGVVRQNPEVPHSMGVQASERVPQKVPERVHDGGRGVYHRVRTGGYHQRQQYVTNDLRLHLLYDYEKPKICDVIENVNLMK